MLWTLWRAILIEFWRLLLLSAGVLVTVVAFAATVKPLADGKLTADQAIRFMRYAILPMLAYTLPFAGGFAATMAYHRFVVENEVTAAHAGGVSHRRLLLPALASGLLLGGVLMGLNDRVIPGYLRSMEEMITRDFARLMVNSLRQGEAARIGSTEIHADIVDERPPEPGSPVQEQFLMAGVAMVETDASGAVTLDGTARRAWIQLMPVWALNADDRARIGDQVETAIILRFIDMTVYRAGAPQSADLFVLPAIPIASTFKDNPKFYSGRTLRRIERDPGILLSVDRRRVELARVLAAARSFERFGEDLARGRPIRLNTPDGSAFTVMGGGLSAEAGRWVVRPLPESGRIEITVAGPGGHTDRLVAEAAALSLQTPVENDPLADRSMGSASRFALDLAGVRVLGVGTELSRTTYRDLWPADDLTPATLALPLDGLLAQAREEPAAAVRAAVAQLDREIGHQTRKALAKRHDRWVLSAACVVMVVLGAVMAMHLKRATPLVIYLWSFFPALGTIIIAESGAQAINRHGPSAVWMSWSGVVLLAGLTVVVYRRMSKL